jgi:phosphatidylserine/phosphatidylglycerophosphate/cardiolipin synthase-like enzyme
MATTLFKEVSYSLSKLVQDIEMGEIGLPDIQRPFDPRSLETETARRASLHAKCIVVDKGVAFVSSANFTEAAQSKNVEVGVLLRSTAFARRLIEHFEALASEHALAPVPLTTS